MSSFKPSISREQFIKNLFQFSKGAEAFGRLYNTLENLETSIEDTSNLIDAGIFAILAHFDLKEGTDLHGYAFDLIFDISSDTTWKTDFEAVASNLYTQLIELHDEQEDLTNE